jgi:hypothetical protein
MNLRLRIGCDDRHRYTTDEADDGLMAAKPSLTDRMIPALPVPHEWRRHIRKVSGQQEIKKLHYLEHSGSLAAVMVRRFKTEPSIQSPGATPEIRP